MATAKHKSWIKSGERNLMMMMMMIVMMMLTPTIIIIIILMIISKTRHDTGSLLTLTFSQIHYSCGPDHAPPKKKHLISLPPWFTTPHPRSYTSLPLPLPIHHSSLHLTFHSFLIYYHILPFLPLPPTIRIYNSKIYSLMFFVFFFPGMVSWCLCLRVLRLVREKEI